MSEFVQHEGCPECKSKDNLGRYADGSAFCFGCGYFEKADRAGTLQTRKNFEPREYQGLLQLPEQAMRDFMYERYNVYPETLADWSVYQPKGQQALLMPCFGPDHIHERGRIMRYWDGSTPKAVSYKTLPLPWQAWFVNTDGPLVIVEDQVSALRCWQLGYSALSLLGAHLGKHHACEIQNYLDPGERATLALDRDKFSVAVGFKRKYHWIGTAALLGEDLKDIDDDEIRERLRD